MKQLLIAITLVLLAIATMPIAAQTGQQTFQQALVAEQAKGDLEEAIRLYQRAAREAGADRALAARALLAAARCYEKLGQTGAVKLYEEITRLYADQREQAAAARERLAALTTSTGERFPGMVVGQLTVPTYSGPYMQLAGNELVYVDRRTEARLMAADRFGRSERVLVELPARQRILSFSVAPNNRDIAAAIGDLRRGSVVRFCVTSVKGGGCRTVLEQAVFCCSTPQAVRGWSPDGRRFLAMIREQNDRVLVSVSASDGSVQRLANLGPAEGPGFALNYLKSARYSPDGKYVAWTHEGPREDRARDGKVHVVMADGSGEGTLVDYPGPNNFNKFLEWTADGRQIVFLSNRDGQQALFVQPVSNGKTAGPARRVTNVPGRVYYSSMLADGTLLYSTFDVHEAIYTTRIDSSTGAFVGSAEPLSRRPTKNRLGAWSPDGKQYAYVGLIGEIADGQPILVVGQMDSGQERLLPFTLEQPGGPLAWLAWVGRSLYLARVRSIDRIDVETGAKTPLIAAFPPGRQIQRLSTAVNDPALLVDFTDGVPITRAGVLRVDIETGQTTEVAVKDGARSLVLTSDGSQAASLEGANSISVKRLGGEWKPIANLTGESIVMDLQWMPDGKALQVVRAGVEDVSSRHVVLRIPLEGGPAQKLGEAPAMGPLLDVQPHPNGDRVMFRTAIFQRDFWSVRNYALPAVAPSTVKR